MDGSKVPNPGALAGDLERVRLAIRTDTAAFERGGRLLDAMFSRSAQRKEATRRLRLGYLPEQNRWTAEDWSSGSAERVRQARNKRAIRKGRHDEAKLSLLGRLTEATRWVRSLGSGDKLRSIGPAEAEAACIVAWLLDDRHAHQCLPLLCEFQSMPWEPLEEGPEDFQERGLLSDCIDSQLLIVLHEALRVVGQREPIRLKQPQELVGMHSSTALADYFGVDPEALRKRLDRWRAKNLDNVGWTETTDRKPNAPRYLFDVQKVRHLIEELRARE
jgi:hypothetical protein